MIYEAKSFRGRTSGRVEDVHVLWCCVTSRTFVRWVYLCRAGTGNHGSTGQRCCSAKGTLHYEVVPQWGRDL